MLKPAAALAALLLWPLSGHAAELPCPPKSYFCWQAQAVFKEFGIGRVLARLKVCGWTRDEISEAMKCK